MSSNRESIRVAALVLLLFVAGAAGTTWTDGVMAQERRASSAAVANSATDTSHGSQVLIAVGTLQLVGVLSFELLAFGRRRKEGSSVTPARFSRVPSLYRSRGRASTSQTRQAA